jgi:hypothetical protein
MKIHWLLYDSEGIDPENPLGLISITDESGGEIKQEATYIDTWIRALLQAIKQLRLGATETIEATEGPDPLELRIEEGRVAVTHGLHKVNGGDMDSVESAVREEAARFLSLLKSHDRWKANASLAEIERQIDQDN